MARVAAPVNFDDRMVRSSTIMVSKNAKFVANIYFTNQTVGKRLGLICMIDSWSTHYSSQIDCIYVAHPTNQVIFIKPQI